MRSVPRCFIPGCHTGYPSDRKRCKSEGRKCLNLFCVPRNEEMLEKWKRAIPQSFQEFKWTDYVCEKHFDKEDIDLYWIQTLPDGTSHVHKRKKPKLKTSAVPCIFPQKSGLVSTPPIKKQPQSNLKEVLVEMPASKPLLPVLISFDQSDTASVGDMPEGSAMIDAMDLPSTGIEILPTVVPEEETDASAVSQEENSLPEEITPVEPSHEAITKKDASICKLPNIMKKNDTPFVINEEDTSAVCNLPIIMKDDSSSPNPLSEESISKGCYLADCLKYLELPSDKWSIHTTANDYIVCAWWNHFIEPEKRVIVLDDLSVRVLLNEVDISCPVKITTVGVLYSILQQVEQFRACKGSKGGSTGCEGIAIGSTWCKYCRQMSKRLSTLKSYLEKKKLKNTNWESLISEQEALFVQKKNQVAELKKQIENERLLNKELTKLDAIL